MSPKKGKKSGGKAAGKKTAAAPDKEAAVDITEPVAEQQNDEAAPAMESASETSPDTSEHANGQRLSEAEQPAEKMTQEVGSPQVERNGCEELELAAPLSDHRDNDSQSPVDSSSAGVDVARPYSTAAEECSINGTGHNGTNGYQEPASAENTPSTGEDAIAVPEGNADGSTGIADVNNAMDVLSVKASPPKTPQAPGDASALFGNQSAASDAFAPPAPVVEVPTPGDASTLFGGAAAAGDPFAATAPAVDVVAAGDASALFGDAVAAEDPFSTIALPPPQPDNAVPAGDASALFGGTVATGDPFSAAAAQTLQTDNDSPAEDASALFGGATAAEDPFSVAVPQPPQADIAAPAGDASALFGGAAAAGDPFAAAVPPLPEVDNIASAADASALFDSAAAAGDPFPAAAPVEDGSSAGDASALFGGAAAAEDPFSTIAPPLPQVDNAVSAGDASALFGGAAAAEDPFSTIAPPPPQADDAVPAAGNAAPAGDASALFGGVTAAGDSFPLAAPAADNIAPTGDASALFGGAVSAEDPFSTIAPPPPQADNAAPAGDASTLFGGAAAAEDPFSTIAQPSEAVHTTVADATYYQGTPDASPEQSAPGHQTDPSYNSVPAADLFGAAQNENSDVAGLFGASSASGEVSDLFGAPHAGAVGPFDAPHTSVADGSSDASFFDSLAPAPAPVAQQEQHAQQGAEQYAAFYHSQQQQSGGYDVSQGSYDQAGHGYAQHSATNGVQYQSDGHDSHYQQADVLQQGVADAYSLGAFDQQSQQSGEYPAVMQTTGSADASGTGGSAYAGSDAGVAEVPLPYPWQAHVDPGTGCVYYFNGLTGQSSWEPPVESDAAQQLPEGEQVSHGDAVSPYSGDAYSQHGEAFVQGAQGDVASQQSGEGYSHHGDVSQYAQHQAAHNQHGAYQDPQAGGYNTYAQDQHQHQYVQQHQHDASGQHSGHFAQPDQYEQSQQPHQYAQGYDQQHSNAYPGGEHHAHHQQQWENAQQQQYEPQNQGYGYEGQAGHGVQSVQAAHNGGQAQNVQADPNAHLQNSAQKRGGYQGKIFIPGQSAAQQQQQQQQPQEQNQQHAHQYQQHHQQQHHAQATQGLPDGGVPMHRPPHPVAVFGFGGRLVVASAPRGRGVNVFSGQQQDLDAARPVRPAPVALYELKDFRSSLLRQLEAFPGPLHSVPRKKLRALCLEQAAGALVADADSSLNPQGAKLLWEFLAIAVDCGGDLAVAGEENPATGVEQVAALIRSPDHSAHQFMNGGGGMEVQQLIAASTAPSGEAAQAAAAEMQELLLQGKREEACHRAMDAEMWAPALLLSSYISIEMYTVVMARFAQSSFAVGTPLRTLYTLFANQGAELLAPAQLEGLVDAWQQNLTMILGNRTPGDNQVIAGLGDGLLSLRGDVEAAHLCYLLAGVAPEPLAAAPGQHCRLALLGADHNACPASFATAAALQRTEVWEQARRYSNPKAVHAPLLVFKLQHALLLADLGLRDKALKYLEHSFDALRAAGKGVAGPALAADLEMLDHRLRTLIGGKAAAGSSAGGAGLLGGLKGIFDSAVSKAIYGDVPGAVPGSVPGATRVKAPHPPAQGPGPQQQAQQQAQQHAQQHAQQQHAQQQHVQQHAQQQAEARAEHDWRGEMERRAREEADRAAAPDKAKADDKTPSKGRKEEEGGEAKPGLFRAISSKILGSLTGEKQVDLGEENTLYFNEELQRWVERGKEHEVEAEASNAPPPTMAAFHAPAAAPDGGAATPVGTPGGPGGMPTPGGGLPPGGNMFARQQKKGARSRYVDTLNPNAASPAVSTPGGAPPGGTPASAKPKPAYKIFVPQAQTQTQENGAQ